MLRQYKPHEVEEYQDHALELAYQNVYCTGLEALLQKKARRSSLVLPDSGQGAGAGAGAAMGASAPQTAVSPSAGPIISFADMEAKVYRSSLAEDLKVARQHCSEAAFDTPQGAGTALLQDMETRSSWSYLLSQMPSSFIGKDQSIAMNPFPTNGTDFRTPDPGTRAGRYYISRARVYVALSALTTHKLRKYLFEAEVSGPGRGPLPLSLASPHDAGHGPSSCAAAGGSTAGPRHSPSD